MNHANLRKRAIFIGLGTAALVWVAALAVMGVMRSSRPTAEKVAAYMDANPFEHLPTENRQAYVAELARRMNQLPFEQRQQVRQSGRLEELFNQMNEQERIGYLEQTLPSGFTQLLDAMNKMEETDRRKMIEKAMTDLDQTIQREKRGQAKPYFSEEERERIMEVGLKSLFSEASSQTKLDLQPLMEQLQKTMRSRR